MDSMLLYVCLSCLVTDHRRCQNKQLSLCVTLLCSYHILKTEWMYCNMESIQEVLLCVCNKMKKLPTGILIKIYNKTIHSLQMSQACW